MEQRGETIRSAASVRTGSCDPKFIPPLQTTQVAAWTVENSLGIFRYVLRSDNVLCYRWKFSKLTGRWFRSMAYYAENRDCRTPEEAEELFEYLGWDFKIQPARDGYPFRGIPTCYDNPRHVRPPYQYPPIERPGAPRMLSYFHHTRSQA